MPCTCNAICDNDCGSNQLRTGRVGDCETNDFSFTGVFTDTVILAAHLAQLESAINNERTNGSRRFNSSDPAYCFTHTPGDVACTNNDWSAYSFSGSRSIGDVVRAAHYDNVIAANNEVVNDSGYGGLISFNPAVGGVIIAANIDDIQTKINQTRTVCICDSHCNCNPSDCGCNGECPSDDYYCAVN